MLVSRFAPSPTGRLHVGHAYCAALGHKAARASGGRFRLRIDDLDLGRSRPEFVEGIFEDLRWLGLEWDGEPLFESRRGEAYEAALDKLRGLGLVYACFCTRADIAATLEAPHGKAAHYPGTCRSLSDDPERRAAQPHSWRLHSGRAIEIAGLPGWNERDGHGFMANRDDIDDIVLARKDAAASYHLACVVDDAAGGVNLVVRGADLRASTPVQRLLQVLLGLPESEYCHHRLVTHVDGRRLAKRDRAPTLAGMREEGVDGRRLSADLVEGRLPLGFAFADV